jgi:hypothetical protein
MASNINADNGVVSGSAGLKTSADNSGVLALQTNGTTAVTVNASQNVGIATTSPAVKLHVATGGFQYGSSTDYLRLVQFNTNQFGFLCSPLGNYSFNFNTSTGGIKVLNTLGVGDATPSTSGAGITFPATQSASSDANTLDDYEEGTWTPVVGGVTLTGAGRYTKIGRLVSISFANQNGIPALAVGARMDCTGIPFGVVSSAWANTAIPSIGWNNQSTGFLDELACGRLDPTNGISMFNKGTETTTTLDTWGLSLVYYTT